MELMFGIFTVLGGAAYILWQAHKESPGLISSTLVFVLITCGPIALIEPISRANLTFGAIYTFTYIALVVGAAIYLSSGGSEKALRECVNESASIWEEVMQLPEPDEETIMRVKLANNIPLYPFSEAYDAAALDAWRTSEYNKRIKERHRLVVYSK